MSEPSAQDQRRVFRLVFDVLATEAQAHALIQVIGSAICADRFDHEGPCRIAWDSGCTGEGGAEDATDGLDAESIAFARAHLGPIEVWPQAEVNASLGIEERGAGGTGQT